MDPVQYLHFGAQCPGYMYMAEQAMGLANLMGRGLTVINLEEHPELGRRHGIFFPGTILVDGFVISYPGTPEQLYESCQRRGPLPGTYSYRPGAPGQCDRIVPLTPDLAYQASEVCLGPHVQPGAGGKGQWLDKIRGRAGRGILGYVGYREDRAVAVVEMLPETSVPYAIPGADPSSAWITCIYGVSGGEDYRPAVLARLMEEGASLGYRQVRTAAGEETPYPNGPVDLFVAQGFATGEELGEVLLRHRRDRMRLVTALL
ncbi:MAG: hypothetical protein AB1445_06580 [Bacillota bacterium]